MRHVRNFHEKKKAGPMSGYLITSPTPLNDVPTEKSDANVVIIELGPETEFDVDVPSISADGKSNHHVHL